MTRTGNRAGTWMANEHSNSEVSSNELLSRLRSQHPGKAWSQFLDTYSSLIMHLASRSEKRRDRLNDCYLFICSKLCENQFHRLLSYQPEGSASFRSWLNVVITNLCIDWHRQNLGRARPFKCIYRLSQLEQLVFKYKFQHGMSLNACLELMQVHYPELTKAQLSVAISHINTALTPRQHWLLSVQHAETVSLDHQKIHGPGKEPFESSPGPEQTAELAQSHERLQLALGRLTPQQRLLIKLRYQQELSLKEVARLLRLGDPFRARREIQVALDELAKHFDS